MYDIIAAIATAQGRGGVAIVRMSGQGSLAIAQKMFSRRGEWTPNLLYPGKIDAGDFCDYGMCVYFRAPKSFTGEDTVEFHCHGGTEIARGVLSRAIELGARPAERGEFTRRAFINGKLSLAAAEGMAEMINAQSQAQVRAGYSLLSERLTGEIRTLQDGLKRCLAGIDADVDYPEEELNATSRAEVAAYLEEAQARLRALLGQYRAGRKLGAGVNVVLCGRPNAGKSSLLNALIGFDKAIVSPSAGTTRDAVEATIEIRGVLFRLTDTAGLHEGESEVEREGISRARRAVEGADVIVWLKEEPAPPMPFPPGVPVIVAGAKSDLAMQEACDVWVSSVTGEGIARLKELLYRKGYGQENEETYLVEARHFEALGRALAAMEAAHGAIVRGDPAELYAEDVLRAWCALGEISGETAAEEIVTEIFEKFCVGK